MKARKDDDGVIRFDRADDEAEQALKERGPASEQAQGRSPEERIAELEAQVDELRKLVLALKEDD